MHQQRIIANELQSARSDSAIRWFPMASSRLRQFLRSQRTFLLLKPGTDAGKPVLVVPDYSSEGGRIIALRAFPDPKDVGKLEGTFEEYWGRSPDASKFQHKK
jgi:hypothetical protein